MDPSVRVTAVVYRVIPGKGYEFQGPPVEFDCAHFSGRIDGGLLTCRLKAICAGVTEARRRIEPTLRAWEAHSGLLAGRQRFAVLYDHPELEADDGIAAAAGALKIKGGAARFTLGVSYPSSPPSPSDFVATDLVRDLWARYEQYLDGREILTGFGYYVLSRLEKAYGGRKRVARALVVDKEILNTLGTLTSERGDKATARKAGTGVPLTTNEERWILDAVGRLIYRAGELAAGVTPLKVTKADLPELP